MAEVSSSQRGLSPTALLVAGAFFMEFLDGTVIATALPEMARTFGVEAVDLNIGISAYLLTLAVFIPASGWIADRFGARSVFTLALAIFTLSSVFCGMAQRSATTSARIARPANRRLKTFKRSKSARYSMTTSDAYGSWTSPRRSTTASERSRMQK